MWPKYQKPNLLLIEVIGVRDLHTQKAVGPVCTRCKKEIRSQNCRPLNSIHQSLYIHWPWLLTSFHAPGLADHFYESICSIPDLVSHSKSSSIFWCPSSVCHDNTAEENKTKRQNRDWKKLSPIPCSTHYRKKRPSWKNNKQTERISTVRIICSLLKILHRICGGKCYRLLRINVAPADQRRVEWLNFQRHRQTHTQCTDTTSFMHFLISTHSPLLSNRTCLFLSWFW